MICNLNQLSFQPYGSIESERVNARNLTQKAAESRQQQKQFAQNVLHKLLVYYLIDCEV